MTDTTAPPQPPTTEITTSVDGWPARLGRRIRPPEPWQYRPHSLAAVWRYSTCGGWARNSGGFVRRTGQLYAVLIAIPTTFVTHYLAWLVARPSRLIVAVGLYLLIANVGPLSPYLP